MSGAKHTPGPWIIDRGSAWDRENPPLKGDAVAGVETAFSSITIRATGTAGKPCPSTEAPNATGEANARLIAAAPELLEALKSSAKTAHYRGKLACFGSFEGCSAPSCIAWKNVIAKAEGGQP